MRTSSSRQNAPLQPPPTSPLASPVALAPLPLLALSEQPASVATGARNAMTVNQDAQ